MTNKIRVTGGERQSNLFEIKSYVCTCGNAFDNVKDAEECCGNYVSEYSGDQNADTD